MQHVIGDAFSFCFCNTQCNVDMFLGTSPTADQEDVAGGAGEFPNTKSLVQKSKECSLIYCLSTPCYSVLMVAKAMNVDGISILSMRKLYRFVQPTAF